MLCCAHLGAIAEYPSACITAVVRKYTSRANSAVRYLATKSRVDPATSLFVDESNESKFICSRYSDTDVITSALYSCITQSHFDPTKSKHVTFSSASLLLNLPVPISVITTDTSVLGTRQECWTPCRCFQAGCLVQPGVLHTAAGTSRDYISFIWNRAPFARPTPTRTPPLDLFIADEYTPYYLHFAFEPQIRSFCASMVFANALHVCSTSSGRKEATISNVPPYRLTAAVSGLESPP